MENVQPLATKKETASYLGVTEKTVDRLRKEQKLKAIKVGKKIRFKWDDLKNLEYENN